MDDFPVIHQSTVDNKMEHRMARVCAMCKEKTLINQRFFFYLHQWN